MLRRSLCVLKNGRYVYALSHLKFHTSVLPLYSKFDKDFPNPKQLTPVSKLYGPDTDILHDQLRKSNSIDRLLDLIHMHLDVMNTKHMVVCLENIHEYAKNDKNLIHSLPRNEVFKSFSSRLMKVIRLFEPSEVITAYKTFCTLEVRSNTYVMQSILKMLGTQLNNMTLGQLTFLSFLLHRQRHNSLVDGLRLALPLVVQFQIDQQLDSDNLTEVVNCLQLSCRAGLKPISIQKIVNTIIKKASILSTNDAVTVIFSLLNMDTPVDGYNELINISFETVARNIEDITPKKLSTILRTCQNRNFYHVTFFYAIADLIVSRKWNLDLTYWAIFSLYSLNFCPANLIDHFADVLCTESELYQSNNLYSPLSCIEYLTGTSYRPTKIDEAARVLYSNEQKLQYMATKNQHLFLKFLSCLAMLGHFPHELLSTLLDEEFLFNAWSLSRKLGRGNEFDRHLLSLHWSLQLYGEEKNFTIPSSVLKKVLISVYQKNLDIEYPLTKFIENGLGGSQFLQSGVFTEDGHVIDHIVAMRIGNYPVSLENMKPNDRRDRLMPQSTFVEDITLPEDAKIVAILVAEKRDYLTDPEILRGWMDLKVRSLEKKNYATVVINHNLWKNLPDREKIPYLMREIKEVAAENCSESCTYR